MRTHREFAAALVTLLAAATLRASAFAQVRYPTKAVEVVVPFAPGGGTDNLMRTIVGIIDENKWSPVPINVNNRAGGSGVIGYTDLLGKTGDSHVIAGAAPTIVSSKIEGRLAGNYRDMTVLTIVAIDELMLSVRADSKYQTIEEFVKAAKERPGITGSYSQSNKLWDVGQMLVFGVLGYGMRKLGYSPAALTLALVLGPLAERAPRQSLIISESSVLILFQRPISAVLTTLALLAVAVPVVRAARGPWRSTPA